MPTRTNYPEGVPCWIDLSSSDPDAAKRYYARLFGWEFEDLPSPRVGTYAMASLAGRHVAAVGGQPPGTPDGTPSLWNTYLACGDVTATAERAEGAGGRVLMPPADIGDAGRMAFVADPTGAVVGLWEAGRHIGAGLGGEPGSLVWSELVTSEPSTALAFYGEVAGVTHTESPMPGGTYTLLHAGGEDFGGCTTPRVTGAPAHWQVYLAVDDPDDAAATSRAAGGSVPLAPYDVPGAGRIAVLADPTGGTFGVLVPRPDA